MFYFTEGWRFSAGKKKLNTPFNFEGKPTAIPSSTPSPQFVQLRPTSTALAIIVSPGSYLKAEQTTTLVSSLVPLRSDLSKLFSVIMVNAFSVCLEICL